MCLHMHSFCVCVFTLVIKYNCGSSDINFTYLTNKFKSVSVVWNRLFQFEVSSIRSGPLFSNIQKGDKIANVMRGLGLTFITGNRLSRKLKKFGLYSLAKINNTHCESHILSGQSLNVYPQPVDTVANPSAHSGIYVHIQEAL